MPTPTPLVPLASLQEKTIVITGGASGIGLAIATRAAKEGASLMLADIEDEPLQKAAEKFRADGISVRTEIVDVSKRADVERLADSTYRHFGAAHVIVNNAGVSPKPAPVWRDDDKDWQWLMGVNFDGVRSGIRAFVPRMLEAKTPGHIVNTASLAGLSSVPNLASYVVTKHAVVALSECLYHDLIQAKANIGVSVVCPAFIKTRIHESQRNRPGAVDDKSDGPPKKLHPMAAKVAEWISKSPPPSFIADAVVDAIFANQFWVIPREHSKQAFADRANALLEGLPPASSMDVRPPKAS